MVDYIMTKAELKNAVRSRLAEMNTALSKLPDDIATDVTVLFEKWKTDTDYVIGDRRQYNGTLWKCIQNRTYSFQSLISSNGTTLVSHNDIFLLKYKT